MEYCRPGGVVEGFVTQVGGCGVEIHPGRVRVAGVSVSGLTQGAVFMTRSITQPTRVRCSFCANVLLQCRRLHSFRQTLNSP